MNWGDARFDQYAAVFLVTKSTNLFQANSVPSLKLSIMSVPMKKPTNSPAMMSCAVCRTRMKRWQPQPKENKRTKSVADLF